MANLKDVIYLSAEDYNTLYTNGTVTINGTTLTYDANNIYIVPDDTDTKISTALANYIAKSSTAGLVKNDGTIDTNTYLTSSALTNYIQTSLTTGLIKNDGTIDTNTYLTSIPSTYIQTSSTSGLIKNDGSIDTNTYLTSSDISSKRNNPTTATTFSGSVAENTNYILSSAISSLTISSIANSGLESNIIFEVTGSSFSITFPSNTPMIGEEPTYESGEKYIVSICNGIVIVAPITV